MTRITAIETAAKTVAGLSMLAAHKCRLLLTKLLLCLFCVALLVGPVHARSFKRGICYGYHSPADMAAIAPGVSWWYNWAVTPENSVADTFQDLNMEFVPMAWNGGFDQARLRTFLQSHPDVKYILGFNEPNFISQANMTPSAAAAAWPALEAIADEFGLEIVGPAVNFCGDCVSENGTVYTDPVDYLDDFFAACSDCRVDYIAVHNYMCYQSALEWYIGNFYKYGKRIWLTEFACWDQPASVVTRQFQIDYMRDAVAALESDTMVFRYAWFIGRTGNIDSYPYQSIFAEAPGVLTELGSQYVDLPAAAVAAAQTTGGAAGLALRTSLSPRECSFTFESGDLPAGALPAVTVVNSAGREVPTSVVSRGGSVTAHLNAPAGVAPGVYAVLIQFPGRSFTFTIAMQ
jgi:hypothetical protein